MYLLPPLALCALLTGMVTLHLLAPPETYFAIVRRIAPDAWFTPFLDAHGIIAALECHGHGLPVNAFNPCDTLGRPHNYAPVWLWLAPLGLQQSHTVPLGMALGLTTIVAIAALCRASLPSGSSPWRFAALSAACVSPAVIYGLERGNIDLLMFALIIAAARLCAMDMSGGRRLAGYAIATLAGLLKYYPIVLFAGATREKLPRCITIMAAGTTASLLYFAAYGPDLIRSAQLVPTFNWHSVAFGANVLPRGLSVIAPGWPALRHLLMAGLGIGVLATVLLLNRGTTLRAHIATLSPAQQSYLMAGALILTACFVAGQNIGYRAIFLLLLLPAALALAGRSRLFALLAALAVALCWYLAVPVPHRAAHLGLASVLAWLAIQFAWWVLFALLLAIALNMTLHSAAAAPVLAWARRLQRNTASQA